MLATREGAWLKMSVTLALRIKRTVPIITAPVIVEGKPDDRNADSDAILKQRYALPFIRVGKLTGVEPAPVPLKRHIAPAPAIDASIHIHRLADAKIGDRGIVGRWARQKRFAGGHIGFIGAGHRRKAQNASGDPGRQKKFQILPAAASDACRHLIPPLCLRRHVYRPG
jgi:hypothetical protein